MYINFPDNNLHDFDVYIGAKSSHGDFASAGYTLCHHYTGTVASGDIVTVECSTVIHGRYVAIQISGSNQKLTLCEVQVFRELGK